MPTIDLTDDEYAAESKRLMADFSGSSRLLCGSRRLRRDRL